MEVIFGDPSKMESVILIYDSTHQMRGTEEKNPLTVVYRQLIEKKSEAHIFIKCCFIINPFYDGGALYEELNN